ncbi:hypothetical protein FisN_30Hu089 [Fistulifera solaris]|uniref:Nudix hydrolase domain-containing protein n=1 Tax=Fistulifera solaris TaxID=1519565 RepID=A0A1Z5K7I6_FISSO|nr:hypothetical protein FisN_30Hu089 [Fistulifera solaris]|eukprot:GAX21888.1 hypothetical protein FisN_30Hu089 [Fistulifera solaris]
MVVMHASSLTTTMIPRAAVSVVVHCQWSSQNYYLLVQRGKEPAKGKWSFPGGKIEWGESTLAAAVRELREETKWATHHHPLEWYPGTVCTSDSIGSTYHYLIAQCYAQVTFPVSELPVVAAADDAADVGWWTLDDMETLDTTPGLSEVIRRIALLSQHGMLPTVSLEE